ncbi:hypothetical protein M758_12G155500 [Ceratodon purpureus]|uniref:Uncharacterized protein n=1 Tax=Ceratodon purpureus TaxID=3225 RepID=A0A8T0GA29_CERPU|nr:hypothetical protein KC19_12G153300 [Ceratodon purpureus]KAG0599488.1 hypothetical protein M758_12G155500 [Ceratodon purpureus]
MMGAYIDVHSEEFFIINAARLHSYDHQRGQHHP